MSQKFGSQINELWDSFGQDFTYPGNLPAYADEYFEEETSPTKALNGDIMAGSVQCLPLPGKQQIWDKFSVFYDEFCAFVFQWQDIFIVILGVLQFFPLL